MKKFMVILSLLVFSLVSVRAEEVNTFNDLKQKLEEGTSVELAEGYTGDVNQTIVINKPGESITLDLGGKTLKGDGTNKMFEIKAGNVTIKNGTIDNTAGNDSAEAGMIYVYGSASQDSNTTSLTIESNVTVTGPNPVVISSTSNANYGTTVNINGTLTATKGASDVESSALTIHGTIKNGNVQVNVTGNLTGIDAGIYQAGTSTITVTGSTVTGKSGIVTKAGTLALNNANVSGTGEETSASAKGDGFVPTGAGIQIESNNNVGGDVDVTVDGGSVTSTYNSAIQEYNEGEDTKVKNIAVKGNATLESNDDKDVITGSDKFNENQKDFIAKGTVLKGKTEKVTEYLAEGLSVNSNGTVYDPSYRPSPTPTPTPDPEPSDTEDNKPADKDNTPKTGNVDLMGITSMMMLLSLVGIVTLKKSM